MAVLMTPPLDSPPWPTLGYQVAAWLEARCVYGPGPVSGQPYRVEPEFLAQLCRAYEVFPQGHPRAGRRRFKRVVICLRKGTAKSEKLALVAVAESHPEAPVRCDGFDADGQPVGVGCPSMPFIPLLATTKDQSEDLAYAVAKYVILHSDLVDDYDVGEDRIMLLGAGGAESGRIMAVAGAPGSRDGARTTFQGIDESHRLHEPRLVKAHATMLENTYKLVDADAWTLEVTTSFEPGQNSVAEGTRDYAEQVIAGKVDDPALFYFERFAPLDMPLDTVEDVTAALVEASGPAAEWSGDIPALASHYFEPTTDRQYYRRVWLNQVVRGGGQAFDVTQYDACVDAAGVPPPDGSAIVLGFDGGRFDDSTALVATDIASGFQWLVGLWEKPENEDDWETPVDEVDAAVDAAFTRWRVSRFYCDPPYWDDWLAVWAGRYGSKRVTAWWTNRNRDMALAVAAYRDAIASGAVTHDGDPDLRRHVSNAVKKDTGYLDDDGQPLYLIRKDRPKSPRKIDAAMAAILSWRARLDAVARGETRSKRQRRAMSFNPA